jgi:hypothetical protein
MATNEHQKQYRQMIASHEGVTAVRIEFQRLCETIALRLEIIRVQDPKVVFQFGQTRDVVTISSLVSMQATWIPPYADRVGPMEVLWTNFELALPNQEAWNSDVAERYQLSRLRVVPEVSSANQWMWTPSWEPELKLTTDELAAYMLRVFFELYRKRAIGQILPPDEW